MCGLFHTSGLVQILLLQKVETLDNESMADYISEPGTAYLGRQFEQLP